MKRYFPFIIVTLVALLTVSAGTLLYRSKRLPLFKISKNQNASENEDGGSLHVRGNPKALVTLDLYADFQCPPCGNLSAALAGIEREFGDGLRVVFHNFPLTIHQHARDAAGAAEAAGRQGRFWEMHDLLYKEQGIWSKLKDPRELFTSYAGMLRLNREQFTKDMDSEQVKARVAADQERARSLGVENTPTIFINGTVVPPTSFNPPALRAAISEAVRNAKQKEKPL